MGFVMLVTCSGTVNQIFTPRNIPNLIYWFDFGNESTITESAGSVSQVDDLSYNDNHATQTVSGSQPTTGTLTMNGRNVLDFDSDYLDVPATLDCYTNPSTYFVVFKSDSLDNVYRIAFSEWDNTSSARQIAVGQHGAANLAYNSYGPANSIVSGTSAGDDVSSISTSSGVSTSSGFHVNGNSPSYRTSVAESSSANGVIGGVTTSATWRGVVAEVFGATHLASSSQITKIQRYSYAKWGV